MAPTCHFIGTEFPKKTRRRSRGSRADDEFETDDRRGLSQGEGKRWRDSPSRARGVFEPKRVDDISFGENMVDVAAVPVLPVL